MRLQLSCSMPDAPEQVTTALVSQTAYKDVRDGYAVYFFKEEVEEPVSALCESKEYVIDHRAAANLLQPVICFFCGPLRQILPRTASRRQEQQQG